MHCRACGPACNVLDRSFRLELQRDPSDWYGKIRRRLGGEVLISSDKNLAKLKRHDPGLHLHLLILFKSPEQAVQSYLKERARRTDEEVGAAELSAYLDKWAASYKALLTADNHGKMIALNFEHFCAAPAKHLKRLCRQVNLTFDQSVLEAVEVDQHHLGGNRRVARHFRQTRAVRIERMKAPVFAPSIWQAIRSHGKAREVFEALLRTA